MRLVSKDARTLTFIPYKSTYFMENYKKTRQPIRRCIFYVHMTYKEKENFQDPSSNSENPKIEAKVKPKKHSFRLLMALAFTYYPYEWFCSKIDLTKLIIIVQGGLSNNLNKKCFRFLDDAPLKM